mmetsp:Transcript_12133/g.15885  ORF Transcript_12133/g.15885 Transcript_12133/m.15885 type:complete len:215 (-) Transcript_12133:249-893(-)
MKRKGGLLKSFSLILGFAMIADTTSLVRAQSPLHSAISAVRSGPAGAVAAGGFSFAGAGAGASFFDGFSSSSNVFFSAVASLVWWSGDGAGAGTSLAAGGALSFAEAFASSPPPASPPPPFTEATAPAQSLDLSFAHSPSAARNMLVFSGSIPATTLLARTSTVLPIAKLTAAIAFSRYEIFADLSFIALAFNSSPSNKPSKNPVSFVTLEIQS